MEPQEPIPHDKGDFDTDIKRAVLAEALSAFRAKVLANDMLFQAIRSTLHKGEVDIDDEGDIRTNFSVMPHIKDGKYSLCVEQFAKDHAGDFTTDSGSVGYMFLKLGTMEYVPICHIKTNDAGEHGGVIDESFAGLTLGRDTSTKKPTQEETIALQAAARAVLDGIHEIGKYCEQRGVEVVSGELGCPQVLEEAQNTFRITE